MDAWNIEIKKGDLIIFNDLMKDLCDMVGYREWYIYNYTNSVYKINITCTSEEMVLLKLKF